MMFPLHNNSLLYNALIFCLTVYYSMSQRTFYFEDENIRFCTFLSQTDQITLIPAANTSIIANQTPMTFTRPAQFIDNVTNTELALCGFSLENQMNLQYEVSVRYSSGQFTFVLRVFNQTNFDYVSFYVILYTTKAIPYFQSRSLCLKCQILSVNANRNRTEQMNITMNTNRTIGSNYFVKPFIKSMKTRQGGNGYTRLQANFAYWDMFTTKLVVSLSTYESLVEEACITVVTLSSNVVGPNYTYFINDMTIREFNAASLKALPANFGISSNIYGPIFNRKCLIGFYNLYFRDGIKQIFFDTTKIGIQSITQNTPQYFFAQMTTFCVSRQRTCNNTQGIQTGLQECVNCSLMIKNCVFCLTEAECTACANGYFIDKVKKCCPSYLTNCSVCSQTNMCTQCMDGFYVADTGRCEQCSSSISNCYRCSNKTFCFQCADGFMPENFTSCKSTGASTGSNSTHNQTNTNNSTNSNNTNSTVVPDNNNKTSSEGGLSLWMILFISVAGALALLLVVLIVACFIWRKGKKARESLEQSPKVFNNDKKNEVPQSNQLNNEFTDIVSGPNSMQNNKLTTKINSRLLSEEVIKQSQLRPGSGMEIRQGSKFNPYFTNFLHPKQLKNRQQIPTKDVIEKNSQRQRQQNTPKIESMISSEKQKSKDEARIKSKNMQGEGPQTERTLLKKQSVFIAKVSKNSHKQSGGSIRLKANYYK